MTRELAFEFGRVGVVPRASAKEDSTFLETALILGRAFLRNAGPDQRAQQRSRRTTGAGAGDSPRNRTRDNEAETGNGDRGGRRNQRSDRRADSQSDPAADASALGC